MCPCSGSDGHSHRTPLRQHPAMSLAVAQIIKVLQPLCLRLHNRLCRSYKRCLWTAWQITTMHRSLSWVVRTPESYPRNGVCPRVGCELALVLSWPRGEGWNGCGCEGWKGTFLSKSWIKMLPYLSIKSNNEILDEKSLTEQINQVIHSLQVSKHLAWTRAGDRAGGHRLRVACFRHWKNTAILPWELTWNESPMCVDQDDKIQLVRYFQRFLSPIERCLLSVSPANSRLLRQTLRVI